MRLVEVNKGVGEEKGLRWVIKKGGGVTNLLFASSKEAMVH